MKRRIVPTEEQEQTLVIQWADLYSSQCPDLSMLIHVPNGEYRPISTGKRLKRLGTRKGYPDLVLDVPRGPYHGLRIEMKRTKGGRVSADQQAWLDRLSQHGYLCQVCYGADEAVDVIIKYLDLPRIWAI